MSCVTAANEIVRVDIRMAAYHVNGAFFAAEKNTLPKVISVFHLSVVMKATFEGGTDT